MHFFGGRTDHPLFLMLCPHPAIVCMKVLKNASRGFEISHQFPAE